MGERMHAEFVLVIALFSALAQGCTSSPPDGVARSCSAVFSEGDPCEGNFRCNLDCRVAMDGYGYSCWGGRILRSANDCGLVRDSGTRDVGAELGDTGSEDAGAEDAADADAGG